MKNNHKDRYECKLMRFLKELDNVKHNGYIEYQIKKDKLMRKYGLNEGDFFRACHLVNSGNKARRFFKKSNSIQDMTFKEVKYLDHCKDELKED